ncbi:MAG: hypothetical protein J6E43_08245, partial [Prevotella sp.]|nr:hypothetical protein [Prevotella sp.]
MTGKRIAWWLPLVALLIGCGGRPTAQKLVEIDSLLAAEKNDSAYQVISTYDAASFQNEADRAYYNLLMTHAAVVSYHWPESDSLINEAIRYYKRKGDKERLTDSYYYLANQYMHQEDWQKSIETLKLAEEQVEQTGSDWLKCKVYDALALVNERTANYQLTLDYEKKALGYALRVGRRSTIAYAYSEIAQAFAFMEQPDSAAYYTDQMIPYLDDLIKSSGENFDPIFLSNIGYNYMSVGRYEEAEDYLAQSLKIKETAVAYEDLAWIYQMKGDEEYANLLRLKANAINDNWPKHKILYHLLQYDIEHQNLEGAEQKLYRMMTISDSLRKADADRTVLEYQRKFDTLVAQEAHRRWLTWAGIALGSLLFVVVLLIVYIRYRRAKERLVLTEQQMLVSSYVNEIAQLKSQQADTDTTQQIEELNGKIRELVEQESPRLVRGKLLYDKIKKGGTTSGWSNDDYKCFIDYYKAIDFAAYCRLQKKYQPKTAHNTFFLILYEMGMEDKDVRRIMG